MGSMPMQVYRAADAEAMQLAVEGLRDLGVAPIPMKVMYVCVAGILHRKLVTASATTSMSGCSSRVHRKRYLPTMGCSSKRRGRTTPAAVSSSDASSSWASMQPDLVRLIGWRLLETGDLLDHVRFRAVCHHWRCSTVCPRGRGVPDPRFHPRRWMMLPEGHGLHPGHGKLRKYIHFINLSTGAIVRSKLPLFSHHCVLDSVDGLLLLQRDQDTAIRLLHPFTGDIAELPPLITLLRQFEFQFSPTEDSPQTRRIWSKFRKIGSTSVSVSADGAITVMIIISGIKCLAIATVGDQQWSVARRNLSFSLNPVSLQGRIYILDHVSTTTRIFQILPPQYDAKPSASSSLPPPPELIATGLSL
ncbi:uncharacterized protein LOC124656876 [Lolium rigidum]|uniref:uncharacterized protein LOC124656876 n=1 Tax=Lolium rigidum TaxID=89674 RepID=UPI001F5C3157|nr:uncharacterized protein LOC124656876 [Lolium rigidum]